MGKKCGEHQVLPSQFFYLTVPKISLGLEYFSVSHVLVTEKTYTSEGYVTIFCRDLFCHTLPKNFEGDSSVLCLGEIPVTKKIVDKRGGYQDFQLKIFCITVPKILVEESFVVSLNSGVKKF